MGGGMAAGEATSLVRAAIDERGLRGLIDNASVALAVLIGTSEVPDDAGESKAESSEAAH